MTRWRRWHGIVAALTLALGMTLSAGPAAANSSAGGCPGKFELLNRREAVRLVLETSDKTRAEANEFIDIIDKNEDNQVCVARAGNIPGGFNYIDNQANR